MIMKLSVRELDQYRKIDHLAWEAVYYLNNNKLMELSSLMGFGAEEDVVTEVGLQFSLKPKSGYENHTVMKGVSTVYT